MYGSPPGCKPNLCRGWVRPPQIFVAQAELREEPDDKGFDTNFESCQSEVILMSERSRSPSPKLRVIPKYSR